MMPLHVPRYSSPSSYRRLRAYAGVSMSSAGIDAPGSASHGDSRHTGQGRSMLVTAIAIGAVGRAAGA